MYPMTYEEFKNKILTLFLENDWEFRREFTREEKQEFVDNHNFDYHESYRDECRNYDEGNINVFDNHGDAFKYIMGLLDDCDMYFYRKTHPRKELEKVDESKYPMTYNEFYKILREKLLEDAIEIRGVPEEEAKERIDACFKPDTDDGYIYYLQSCEDYDFYKSKGDSAYKKIFTPSSIDGYHVDGINNCEFWDYY